MDWQPLGFATVHKKACILQKIRAFFLLQNVLEVDTPLLSLYGTTDPSIESLKVKQSSQTSYLQTSPEFFMKRLLAAGSGSIYQISHAFRDEEIGRHHLTEFTLLEWYMQAWNYDQLMSQVQLLIEELSETKLEIPIYSYVEFFQKHVGFNPISIATDDLRDKVPDNLKSLGRQGLLDYFLSIEIMPKLTKAGWFFVKDYPADQASLAKISESNDQVAERFELFYNDLEIANGFSELQDATEQLQRFEADNENRRSLRQNEIVVDELLIQALAAGLPKCAGVAIGLERLLMVLWQLGDIRQVGLN